jgi:hypothetical protein
MEKTGTLGHGTSLSGPRCPRLSNGRVMPPPVRDSVELCESGWKANSSPHASLPSSHLAPTCSTGLRLSCSKIDLPGALMVNIYPTRMSWRMSPPLNKQTERGFFQHLLSPLFSAALAWSRTWGSRHM